MKQQIEKEYHIFSDKIEKLKKNFPECFDKNDNFNIEKFKTLVQDELNIVKEGGIMSSF